MKRLALLLLAAACGKAATPVIASFAVDKASAFSGDVLTFTWQVSGAKTISIDPGIGAVTGGTVKSVVFHPTRFVLTAVNDAGKTTRAVEVGVSQRPPPPEIESFSATPAQAPAGTEVRLRWRVSNADGVSIDQGVGPQPASGGAVVHPTVNTLYTLTAVGAAGANPVPPAQAMFRVAVAPVIARFDADATSVTQGQEVQLSWSGTATSWSVFDGATTTNLGPLTSLLVTPSPPATT